MTANCGLYWIEIGRNFYIGQSRDLNKRKSDHRSKLRSGKHRNSHMQSAYNKYGEMSFRILELCAPEDLDERENFVIGCFYGTPGCMNQMKAATGPGSHSEESRAKMSAANKGRRHSAESCANMSAAAKGKKQSAETRAKIGAASKGRKPSAETRAKLSAANKGKKMSTESRAKMSVAKSNLTGDQVLEIRRRLDDGEKQVVIARDYKIAQSAVSKIKSRKIWKHI
jgi:group I intron endonuclease